MFDRGAMGHAFVGDEEGDWLLASLGLLKAVEEAVIYLAPLHESTWDERLANADAKVATAGKVGSTSIESMSWLSKVDRADDRNDDDDSTTCFALMQAYVIRAGLEHREGVLDGMGGLHVVDDKGAQGVEASGVGSANYYFHTLSGLSF